MEVLPARCPSLNNLFRRTPFYPSFAPKRIAGVPFGWLYWGFRWASHVSSLKHNPVFLWAKPMPNNLFQGHHFKNTELFSEFTMEIGPGFLLRIFCSCLDRRTWCFYKIFELANLPNNLNAFVRLFVSPYGLVENRIFLQKSTRRHWFHCETSFSWSFGCSEEVKGLHEFFSQSPHPWWHSGTTCGEVRGPL